MQNANADFRNEREICKVNNKVLTHFFPISPFVPSENVRKPFSGGGGQKGLKEEIG